jgi:microcystin-dependent protein
MGTPYLGEIKIISWNFPPKGWAFCDGQLLPINQNQALFSILGTQFGGNGQTTFGLPDFRGRTPVHAGSTVGIVGQAGGEEFHTLTQSEMPAHNHALQASTANANSANPVGNFLGAVPSFLYAPSVSNATSLQAGTITNLGGSQPHENRQPFLVLNFIIALQGIFPSRN